MSIESIENSRPEFEMWVSSSPFEYNTERYPDSSAFPGTYKSIRVDLAWHAWRESRQEVVGLLEANAEIYGDYLAAEKRCEELQARVAELEAERTELLCTVSALKAELDEFDIARIKAQAIREAVKYAAEKALEEGWHTLDSNTLLEYARQIEGQSNG